MKLLVEYAGQLRSAIGRLQDRVELPDGATVSTLLVHLGECIGAHGRPHLLTQEGQSQPCLLVVVNGTAYPSRQATPIVLREGDAIVLLPPIAGG